mgnify:FL=1
MSKYELCYIELYSPSTHGILNDLNKDYIYSNYLLMYKINAFKFLLNPTNLIKLKKKFKNYYIKYNSYYLTNNINTDKDCLRSIDKLNKYCDIRIVERFHKDEYTFAIDKTFWLKIFQRRWKKIYQNKLSIIKKMSNLHNLQHREINGRWSFNTNIYNI